MNSPLIKELHVHELQTNVRSLVNNIKLAYSLSQEEATREIVKRGNQFLWKLNTPVTKINNWFRSHCADLKELETKRQEEVLHQLELERIESEGGPCPEPASDEPRCVPLSA